jgi:hypothetical protein
MPLQPMGRHEYSDQLKSFLSCPKREDGLRIAILHSVGRQPRLSSRFLKSLLVLQISI